MADPPKRPPVRVRFRFNVDTGEMEFLIDDNAPERSETYHDKVAEAIAAHLGRKPDIEDAGAVRHRWNRESVPEHPEKRNEQEKKREQTD